MAVRPKIWTRRSALFPTGFDHQGFLSGLGSHPPPENGASTGKESPRTPSEESRPAEQGAACSEAHAWTLQLGKLNRFLFAPKSLQVTFSLNCKFSTHWYTDNSNGEEDHVFSHFKKRVCRVHGVYRQSWRETCFQWIKSAGAPQTPLLTPLIWLERPIHARDLATV